MSQSSSSSASETAPQLYLPDGTLIQDAVVVTAGKPFDGANNDTAEIAFQDTAVLSVGDHKYRAVCVTKNGDVEYHQLKPEQEEALINEACKAAPDVKPSFTRWTNMIRQRRYPEDASPSERALFGDCLISTSLVKAKMDAKRARDAASRRKRNGDRAALEQPAKKPKEAHIEINASGPGTAVIELLRGLVGKPP